MRIFFNRNVMAEAEGAEAPNVTFVAGRAVEQQEAASSDLDSGTRAKAAKAVKEAMEAAEGIGKEVAEEDDLEERVKDPTGTKRFLKKEAEDAEAEEQAPKKDSKAEKVLKTEKEVPGRAPDGKFQSKEQKEPAKAKEPAEADDDAEEIDTEKASVKQLLKNRERIAQSKKAEQQQRQQAYQPSQQQMAEWQRRQQEVQYKEWQLRQREQELELLRNNPGEAVRRLGLDPQDFILNLAREGTPEGKMAQERSAMQREIEELRQWRQQQAQAEQQRLAQMKQYEVQRARVEAVRDFTSKAFEPDRYPNIALLYDGNPKALVSRGDIVAEEFRRLSGGREGTYEDILDYIEDDLATRITKRYTSGSAQQVSAKRSDGEPAKVSGGRSLSPAMSGERRVAPPNNPLKDLDQEERHEAARQAVKVALAKSRR